MIEKILKRTAICAMFICGVYLIEIGNPVSVGIGLFTIVDMSIVMFKHNESYL